ncbi:MAG TPA: glycoside hydrolase family 9 protein [Gaiellaceae bacterium]
MRALRLLMAVGCAGLLSAGCLDGEKGAAAPAAADTSPSSARSSGPIRIDQLGYAVGERKIAYALASRPVPATFAVVDAGGRSVLEGKVGASRGRWNARYPDVYPLDFSALRRPGVYRIRLGGGVSPSFRVGSSAALFGPRVGETVDFFQAQRDGQDVIAGDLDRRPSHLHDRQAKVYDWPKYENADSDVIVGSSLQRIGGPVDLEGGWFDAGDFIKFTHTTAYAVSLLAAADRRLGPAAPQLLRPEIQFGLDWLEKAWHEKNGVLYLQVGIGSGNQQGTFLGDHDLWRLPEKDDSLRGPENRYLRSRPAFAANAAGKPLPPNLAGRMAAAFALAAQVDARTDPARARKELRTAAGVFAAAKTSQVHAADVVTALPHSFYPESSWRDDLELGAAELALAGQALDDPRAKSWVRSSASWGAAYLAKEAGDDTFNLYDTSALAHADLLRAMRAAGTATFPVGEDALLGDLRAQLDRGVARAGVDPFRAGAIYDDFDAAPHTFGLIVTARLYRELTGDTRYDGFATSQRDWALGANAWGASLMIGVGSTFPHCPQHVVANLSGNLDGSPPVLLGAVVNGPNDPSLFAGGLGEFFEEGHACPPSGADPYRKFSGHGSRYVDDVRSWQTVEPAIDFTAAAALAFALLR